MNQLTTDDLLLGGGAFLTGLLLANLFGSKPSGGCGCGGGHGRPSQFINPTPTQTADGTLGRFLNAKRINTRSATMGELELGDGLDGGGVAGGSVCSGGNTPCRTCYPVASKRGYSCVCRVNPNCSYFGGGLFT